MPDNFTAVMEHTHKGSDVLTVSRKAWPLAMIILGVLASAAWTAGLLYGAYRVARWALS